MAPINYTIGNASGLPLFIIVMYGLFWLLILGLALTHADFDPVTRFMWVVVIIFVPIFGTIFYLVLSPRARSHAQRIDPSNPTLGTPWEDNPGHTSLHGR
jgi:heme/copper-type cytochrome/quinol oxidase subunit 2